MKLKLDYEYRQITKEEYDEAKRNWCDSKKGKNPLINALIEIDFNLKYPKTAIYRDGLFSVINNDIIGYKYYKRGNPTSVIVCSEQQYALIINDINKKYHGYL